MAVVNGGSMTGVGSWMAGKVTVTVEGVLEGYEKFVGPAPRSQHSMLASTYP